MGTGIKGKSAFPFNEPKNRGGARKLIDNIAEKGILSPSCRVRRRFTAICP